ncbi:retinoblastoma-like protein 2 isoform X4 [Salmo salar]|uniref:Retinoblastoma-like protein 2 isoform X4 n=1 Tax=Salmo salar TaxID=8030 RepID=A0ABM3DYY4_SALSA|nr:retinoblastoma-like protein 2 isoform X4 [Salmo salar]|eukprot:XP_014031596.1 PREDICTED: retinoblastoma-like protein 2 isoform X4 [Salmo salar]
MATQRHVPSDSLARTFRSCARNPSEVISTRLRDMLHSFIQHYQEPWEENRSLDRERGVKFSSQTEALYYRVLEAVINQERKRLEAKDLLGILEHDLFQRSLVACCLEMVIFSHQPPGSFPLVIDIFSLAPYDFYKVIELVLRAEEGLLPAVVRRLMHIEEQVLESLAWRRDSPLWDQIRAAKGQGQLPAYHQVMLPQYSEDTDKMVKIPPTPSHLTPSLVSGIHGNDLNSPITHHERYSSPPAGSKMAACPTTPVSPSQSSSVIVTGQTVVTMASATVTTNNGQSVTIPVRGIANDRGGITFTLSVVDQPIPPQQVSSTSTQQPQNPVTHRPQSKGSISLFLRKVYHLVSMRLRDICVKLDICEALRLKIWTCVEHSLVHCTDLMLDRHLDQILMCAIYVMAKVNKVDMPFKLILQCYKTQPQASNSVFRSVLISGRNTKTSQNSPGGSNRENRPRAPCRQDQGERGHLIYFYNTVYVKQMKDFALRYTSSSLTIAGVETPPLSPYPWQRIGSLRRLRPSNHHSLYISPHKPSTHPSPRTGVLYIFSRSTSKSLREISDMMRTFQSRTRKRCAALLQEDGEEEGGPLVKRPCQDRPSNLQRKLRDFDQALTRAQNQQQAQSGAKALHQATAHNGTH